MFIENHLDQRLTAEEVAQHANLSSFHFQRHFTHYIGETFAQYVLHRQLERAAQQLVTAPSKTVLDIAIDTGFATHSAFSRAFKQHFELSPSAFRAQAHRAPFGLDINRPLLKTRAAKSSAPQVVVTALPNMHLNYKGDSGTKNGRFFSRTLTDIVDDFALLRQSSEPLGLVSAFPRSPQGMNDDEVKVLYGALYPAMQPSHWSHDWLTLNQGLWAVCEHQGSYDFLYQTWNLMWNAWLPSSGYELRDALPFEQYFTDPQQLAEKAWCTKIYLPIKSAGSEQPE
nr:AraC family transcriptional regulator [Motilimonas eburnea]